LLRELRRDLPEPVEVERIAGTHLDGKAVRWSSFRTQRNEGEGRRVAGFACGFRIEFPRPVAGPIAVGYGAHFGLGVFVPPIDRFRPVEVR
jgi:CRISPR-associated protein Csb2